MKLLAGMQADRLLTELAEAEDRESVQRVLERLERLGPAAVPRLLETLRGADRQQVLALLEPLARLLTPKSLRHYRDALRHTDPSVNLAAASALSERRNYDPNTLLDLLGEEGAAHSHLLEVIDAHKDRIDPRTLLRYAYDLTGKEKDRVLAIVGDVASEALVPDLLDRLTGTDRDVRRAITQMLARFPREDVARALTRQLDDKDRGVRRAAVRSLAAMPQRIDVARLASMLRDTEIEVQNAAVEVLIALNSAETAPHLVAVLREEENEYARRAAVEVFNAIATEEDVRYLRSALCDPDWWVSTRAVDTLVDIGTDRVVEAVLSLIQNEVATTRQAVVEVLNRVPHPKAFPYLAAATRDPEWIIRERAADALVVLGDRRAVPLLIELLGTTPTAAVIRDLAAFEDTRAIPHLVPFLDDSNLEVKSEAINALARLVDERSAGTLRSRLLADASGEREITEAIAEAIRGLDERFPAAARPAAPTGTQRGSATGRTLLETDSFTRESLEALEPAPAEKLDLNSLQEGDVIAGRYEYRRRIGRGAFGTVLLVRDTVVDEELVLKFLHMSIAHDPETMKRFVQEVRLARRITHRNVIRLYDFLSLDGLYAISMEYFPSHPLTAEVADQRPVPPLRALRIARDVALGMSVAHQEAIVHRDLKPANILVNADDLVKIVDFGVSSMQNVDTGLTKTGYVIGSPKYMAPEQITGKPIDQRVDIYSLGVILYELLTGRPPYADGDQMAVMYAHVQGTATPVTDVNPELPEAVNRLVRRMMAVDGKRRYQSMDEVRADLETLIADGGRQVGEGNDG